MPFHPVYQTQVERARIVRGASILNWKYALVVALTLAVVYYFTPAPPTATVYITIIPALAGIVIGTSVFRVVRLLIPSWIARLVSSLLAGCASFMVGIVLGMSVVCPHYIPEGHMGDIMSHFLVGASPVLTGVIGLAYGAGLGQATCRPEQASWSETT